MKTKLPWILTVLLAIALVAVVMARSNKPVPATADSHTETKKDRTILYWVDPMHPAYKSDKPGIAPDCGMELVPVYADQVAPASGDSNVIGYAAVSLPSQHQQLIGVQTANAEIRLVGRSVRTVGRVAADETRVHRVTTKFDGYIERLYADFIGKPIRRGQPLFSVYSPELLATQQEYLLALRAAKESPYLLEAARRRLKLWDVSDAEIRQLETTGAAKKSLTISSPASGVITVKNAVQGTRTVPGETLFEIADLDRVWIIADVYEAELPHVGEGATATITLSYIPGRIWQGRISFIAPTVDPMTRTVKVRIEVPNSDEALKPEMFADVTITEPTREAVVVPESAVLQTGTRSIVFVVKTDGSFEPREVQTGTKDRDVIEVRRGIAAGEKVVTQANFLIDSESRLKAALAQMSGPGGHQGHGQ